MAAGRCWPTSRNSAGGLDGVTGSACRTRPHAQRRSGTDGRLDRTVVAAMTGQLKELLGPVGGLTARTVRSWLDDIEPAR